MARRLDFAARCCVAEQNATDWFASLSLKGGGQEGVGAATSRRPNELNTFARRLSQQAAVARLFEWW